MDAERGITAARNDYILSALWIYRPGAAHRAAEIRFFERKRYITFSQGLYMVF